MVLRDPALVFDRCVPNLSLRIIIALHCPVLVTEEFYVGRIVRNQERPEVAEKTYSLPDQARGDYLVSHCDAVNVG